MDKMLNTTNRLDQPGSDPFAVPPTGETTGQGSVYETINEYQEAKKNTVLSQQQQDYQWKLQQLELVESEREALEESAYQVMSSASIPDSGGVTATSCFTYPQPYPNSPQSPDNPNPLMMPQAASTDTYPYGYDTGYQFRPCPASAAAGSTLSPIHENRYDSSAGVHSQFNHPHGFHNQAAMEEPDLCMDEGDQDYTFMSQAGTLTSQTSNTAPYYKYSDNDHQISADTATNYVRDGAVKVNKNAKQMAQYASIISRDSQC